MLRRLTLSLCLVGGIAVAAAPASSQGPTKDFLTGSGQIAFTDFPSPGVTTVEQVIVSAHSGPAGEDPSGQITVHSPLLEDKKTAQATVTCLTVSGDTATAGGEFSPPIHYNGLVIRHANLTVHDLGSNDMANSFAFIDRERPPGFSPCNFPGPTQFEVVQGNYVVSDGAP